MGTEPSIDRGTLKRIFTGLASDRWPAPEAHFGLVETELATEESMDAMVSVIGRMGPVGGADLSVIDWDEALAPYADVEFPAYYRMPFHSVPGGWLSEAAAVGDRAAMEAIYADANAEASLGIRQVLADLIPGDPDLVVDFGSGTGDGPAAVAARLGHADVIGLEASPFMLAAANAQHRELTNMEFRQGFAEDSGLPADCADVVTITLVLHECPDHIKAAILSEANRVLRPGGTLLLTDTPNDDLDRFRGFYEPYRVQWRTFDPHRALAEAGFTAVTANDAAPPLWTRVATKPGPTS